MPNANRNRVIVFAVVKGGLSPAEAADRFNVGRQWVHVLLKRYREQGDPGLEPRSRRPKSSPTSTSAAARTRVLVLRAELEAAGLDHGAESIRAYLEREPGTPPSVSTIWRILRTHDQVTPQPQKRPRSSLIRFEAAQPNETWQSDFTHWRIADGTDTEVISWLDDHARFLTHISAHRHITTPVVIRTFTTAADEHGLPASTLTDNGLVYTTRFAHGIGGPNGYEHLLKRLGITQKNSSPAHPQTQGKIERFHQTLKQWLSGQPAALTLEHLNTQLTQFQEIYNTHRPHRALGRRTPAEAYTALPKAEPQLTDGDQHWRVRTDTVDTGGTITIRYAGRLRHLGIGRAHKHTPVIVLISGPDVLVTTRHTGEIIAEHTINPDQNYQPQKPRKPLPKEGLSVVHVPRHL
ncbi:MAG: transposase [Microbacterium sp.]|jgi:transposase InsO family protein|nr:transposase [Microbacterium sp.]